MCSGNLKINSILTVVMLLEKMLPPGDYYGCYTVKMSF